MSDVNSKGREDDFQVVSKKKSFKGCGKSTKVPTKERLASREDISIDINKSKQCILECLEELSVSPYYEDVYKCIIGYFPKCLKPLELVSFGLGNLGQCAASRYQFAFLVLLRNSLYARKIAVHDPLFYKDELKILKEFDIDFIEENTEGCYAISEDCYTVVYLPHCPIALTNNFLWSNWGRKLENCILICNSFSEIAETNLKRHLASKYTYFNKILPHIKEVKPDNSFKHKDIFNNISLHIFPKEKLSNLPVEFWQNEYKKPNYEVGEEDFITAELIKKLVVS